jgi:large subunit ribosomal protein L22
MATAQAKLRNLQIAPRKVRLVADLVRGKSVAQARNTLQYVVKGAALPVRKLLNSAVANAESAAAASHDRIDTDEMVISQIIVNEGRTLHRFQPAPRGSAHRIRKRSSHIELVLTEK